MSKRVKRGALLALGLVGGMLSFQGSAAAEKIIGQITGFEHLLNPVWAEAKSPDKHGYSFRELVPTVPAKFRKLFPHIPKEVCLVALSATPQKANPNVLIRVGGGRTTPVTIVVTPGTKLIFQNTDPFPHRLYGVDLKEFSPSETARGGQREWTVPSAGSFEIRDQLAPSLRMWVVAEPNAVAISYPSIKGEFVLSVPEAGAYDVQAFFAGKKVGPATHVETKGNDLKIAPVQIATESKDDKAD